MIVFIVSRVAWATRSQIVEGVSAMFFSILLSNYRAVVKQVEDNTGAQALHDLVVLVLSNDGDAPRFPRIAVLLAVCENRHTCAKTLSLLAQNKQFLLRLQVARRADAYLGTLVRLSHDPEPEVAHAAKCSIRRARAATRRASGMTLQTGASIVDIYSTTPEEAA